VEDAKGFYQPIRTPDDLQRFSPPEREPLTKMTIYEWIFIGCLCLMALASIIQQIRNKRRKAREAPLFPLDPTIPGDPTGDDGPSCDGDGGGTGGCT